MKQEKSRSFKTEAAQECCKTVAKDGSNRLEYYNLILDCADARHYSKYFHRKQSSVAEVLI